MRKFLFAILCTLSLNANAVLIEATHNLDGQTFVYDEDGFSEQSFILSFDVADFFPGHNFLSNDYPYDSFIGSMYFRWDMVINMGASVFTGPVTMDFQSGGLHSGLHLIIDETFLGFQQHIWQPKIGVLSDFVFYNSSRVELTLQPLWWGQGVDFPTPSQMNGSQITFGQGNRFYVGSTPEYIGIDEPPTALIAALMLGLLLYRGNRLNLKNN